MNKFLKPWIVEYKPTSGNLWHAHRRHATKFEAEDSMAELMEIDPTSEYRMRYDGVDA